jgi:hypothetical protein
VRSSITYLLPDFQIIVNVATPLQEMPSAGYVHQDGNVVWILQENQLSDSGSATHKSVFLGRNTLLRLDPFSGFAEVPRTKESVTYTFVSTTAIDTQALG